MCGLLKFQLPTMRHKTIYHMLILLRKDDGDFLSEPKKFVLFLNMHTILSKKNTDFSSVDIETKFRREIIVNRTYHTLNKNMSLVPLSCQYYNYIIIQIWPGVWVVKSSGSDPHTSRTKNRYVSIEIIFTPVWGVNLVVYTYILKI